MASTRASATRSASLKQVAAFHCAIADAFVRILRFSQVGLVQRREILAAHNLTCPKLDQVLGGMVPVAVAFA